MARIAIVDAEIVDPEARPGPAGASPHCLLIEDGRIVAIRADAAEVGSDWERIRRPDALIAPGFIDVHVHGAFVAAEGAGLAAALARDARAMLASGTTAFLATTLAWPRERLDEFVTAACACAASGPTNGAACLGLHLEGPWISAEVPGALDRSALRPFDPVGDSELFARCGDRLRMVTLAPEVAGAGALLDALAARGVVAALGHSLASQAQLDEAVGRGLRHVTHLFNAMGPMHHREPGVAGRALADDRLSCDLICDGFHVHPAMLRLAARALGERLVLITDRLDLTGLQPRPGAAPGEPLRLADGTIAGSQLGMDAAVRTLGSAAGVDLRAAIAAATLAPARLLGIERERGTLRAGARADLVVLSEEGRVRETWLAGRPIESSAT